MHRLVLVFSLLTLAAPVHAGPLLTHLLGLPPMEVFSTYRNDRFGNIEPATFEIFTLGGGTNRLNLRGIWNSVNMEFILTCPGGQTWHEAGIDARPVLSVIPPGPRGWCTLTITHRTGYAEHRDFAFTYERVLVPSAFGFTAVQGHATESTGSAD